MWFLVLLAVIPGAVTTPVQLAPAETLNLVACGDGAPVVLVPGYCGSAFAFRELIPILTRSGNRVVVVEPLGIGSSSRPRHADYSLTAQADRIAAALDTLGVTRAVVVAHGEAGSMALRLACRRPDLVRGVVSLEGGVIEAAATPGLRRTMKLAPVIKMLGPSLARREMRKGMQAVSGDPSWITEPVLAGYMAGVEKDYGATVDALQAVVHSPEPELLAPRLGEITCPVELLVGGAAHEGSVPASDVKLLRERLSRFRMLTVPGAGHFIHEENPGCVVAAVERIKRMTPEAAGDAGQALASTRPSGPEGR